MKHKKNYLFMNIAMQKHAKMILNFIKKKAHFNVQNIEKHFYFHSECRVALKLTKFILIKGHVKVKCERK